MSEDLKLVLIVALKNIITIICFTILAIVFNKWWIVLFSALFYSNLKFKKDEEDSD